MSERSTQLVPRSILVGDVVTERRQKKWCRLCHHTHALPECGLPKDEPELPVIDSMAADEGKR